MWPGPTRTMAERWAERVSAGIFLYILIASLWQLGRAAWIGVVYIPLRRGGFDATWVTEPTSFLVGLVGWLLAGPGLLLGILIFVWTERDWKH